MARCNRGGRGAWTGARVLAADQGFHSPGFVRGGIFFAHNAASRGEAAWVLKFAVAAGLSARQGSRDGTDAEEALGAFQIDATKCIRMYRV